MSNFEVKILEPSITILEVETISGNNISNIEIIQSGSSIIQLNSDVALLPSEFNSLIDGEIASFIGAGSGIGIESSPGSMIINSLISAGSGIIIDYISGIYNISSNIPELSIENVQDAISNFLVASSGIVLNYQDNNNQLLISTTGLQPSGNYSLTGHQHTASDIIDFNTGVSGLLPVKDITNGNYINILNTNGSYNISVSGLQPSGSYANAIHSHISSDITDFNSSVENLIVVKNISAGSGIDISSTSGLFTVSVTGTFGLTGEEVDDRVNELLVGSNHIHLNYNDSLNTLTISTSGLQPSGDYSVSGHSHSSSEITNFNSSVSGLLPSITGSGYINSVFNTNTNSYTVKLNLPNCGSECAEYFVVFGNGSGQLDLTPHVYEEQIAFRTLGQGSVIDFESQTGYTVFSQIDSALAARSLASHEHGNITSSGHIGSTSGLLVITGNSGILTTTSGVGSSYITNFNSAVSGLIPPSSFTSLSGVSGVVVTNSGTNYTVSLSDPTIQLNDITDLGLDARTFLLTPSSTNLQTLISNETGSGLLVFNTSPALSGIPTVPTASSGTNTTQIANTAFVRTEISNLVNSAPSTLDTLNELATALGNDPNFATTVTNSLSNKANLSGASFTGSVAIPSGTGNFNSLTVNSISVSTSGHLHSYSDITNFASGIDQEVSTLLVAGNYVYLNYDSVADTLTISATGVQPSGSYANSVHSHGNISNSGTIGSTSGLLVTTGNGGILTTSSGISSIYITDFNSGVSGLLPSVSGSGYVGSSFVNNVYAISVSGLQPSGNYANSIHSHITSDITDFNSSVSGLLPVKDIVAGNDISISNSSGIYTINSIVASVDEAASLATIVFNKTGSTIPKMSVVYINGGQGDMPTIQLAIATNEAGSSKTYGITAEAISYMSTGKVIVEGALVGVDTDQFNPTAPVGDINGTVLYLSPAVSGTITTTKPSAPNHLVSVGTVVRTHQNEGVIEVRIQNGFELQELHNVVISGVTNGQFLQYNGSGLWVPTSSGNFTSLSINGIGLSVSGHTHISSDITNFNSSVSGLLPVKNILGSGYVDVSSVSGTYTVIATGLQPSGNYSVFGHSHTSSDVTDFTESVQDVVGSSGFLIGQSGISISYSDTSGTLTITGGSGGTIISNAGNNRILTSTGTSTGINGESNATFDGTNFNISGVLNIDNLKLDNNILSTTISNSDLILRPDGDGSLLADTSGNPRGIYSNDFQRVRTSASGVAAGSYSIICGGSDNRTANSYSTIGGGQTNVASNLLSTICGGDLNTATGNRSIVCGGGSNTSSAQSSTVGGGSNNQAAGAYSTVPGGFRSKATRHGELSHAAGFFNAVGDAQHTILVARKLTSDDTANILTLNSLAPDVLTNLLVLPTRTTWTFTIQISAYNNNDNTAAGWNIRGCIRHNASNATTIVGSNIIESWSESIMSGCVASVTADDTNEALQINVTGLVGKNIRWVAIVDISQVSYGAP